MKMLLKGPAGRLEAIFEAAPRSADLAALVCHPHPVYGGTMHNRVVVRVARALQTAGADVLRMNFRGVGESQGSYDSGIGERLDAIAALEFLKTECPQMPIIVAGFSFGSWVGFRAGTGDPQIKGLLGVGLPLRHFDFDFLVKSPLPKWVIQGEDDEFGSAQQVGAFWETCAEPKGFRFVPKADHFFSDHIEELSKELEQAAAWLTQKVKEQI